VVNYCTDHDFLNDLLDHGQYFHVLTIKFHKQKTLLCPDKNFYQNKKEENKTLLFLIS